MIDKINNPCVKILKDWCRTCNISDIAYELRIYNHTLVIYTSNPGTMIGYKGKIVKKYKRILFEEYGEEFDVEFKVIRGKFLHIN